MSKDYTIPELIRKVEEYTLGDFTDSLVKALRDLAQYRRTDWVPVSELLPEDGVHVIITVRYPADHPRFPGEGFTMLANYDSECNDWESDDYEHDYITTDPSLVTAWRYQPRPYVRTVEVEATA